MVPAMKNTGLIATLFAALMLTASPAAAQRCPATKGSPTVYAIGSSTLGSVLGPMLQRILKDDGIEMHRWGRASSGLARPDFHDWLALAPGLMAKHKPDIVVVSLGTNDFQPLYNKGKWVGLDSEKWEAIYAKRVDKLLTLTGGKKKQRLVIWMGPHAFAGERAEAQGPVVNRIMRERVEAYAAAGGNAVFVDAFGATLGRNGRPLEEAKLPGSSKVERIRTGDNIHLTTDGVRWLMAEPVLTYIRPCIPGNDPVATNDAPSAAEAAPSGDGAGTAEDGGGAVAAEGDAGATATGDAPISAQGESAAADDGQKADGDKVDGDAPVKDEAQGEADAPQAEEPRDDGARPTETDDAAKPQPAADDAAKPDGDSAAKPNGDQADAAKPDGDSAAKPNGDRPDAAKPNGDQADAAKPAPDVARVARTAPGPAQQPDEAHVKPAPPVPTGPPAPARSPSRVAPDRDGDAGAVRPRVARVRTSEER
ncbi:MAG: hypothetical protein CVU56_07935 [Deltaproteobacteria bacterium HGW-Deltaproteobacteria-14]|jgi:hypothetical protein|nr:MAG: hypothetical protein CVU56_07935 [Deltaproteobacteria bacterium HGW-Deltaproteobacteria-14]